MQPDDLIALNEEIASLARAGLPLDQGLAALAQEMGRGTLRRVTAAVASDLRAGHTLPEALQRRGNRVPSYYADLVSAGVRSGRVSEVLGTLTAYARTISALRTLILDSLFYPAIVLAFAVTLASVFCLYIMPQFEQIFKDFNMRLPAVTEMIFRFSHDPFLYFGLPVGVVGGGLLVGWLVLGTSAAGRRTRARLLYALPILGTLVRSARMAAFTDLLAILVDHQTPLPEAFRLAGAASSDPVLVEATKHFHNELAAGTSLGPVLRGHSLVPEWVSWMVSVGELRGTLGQTLHQIAEMYRRQVEMRAGLLRSVLPPFLVICTSGLFVAMFLCVLMLPMIRLIEGLSK